MRTILQVLSEDEKSQIHERTLDVLANTGVRVDTPKGRQLLRDAGAEVDENTRVVRFPRQLVEEALRLAPKKFSLGARRPGWDLQMNSDDCTLLADGEGIYVLDRENGERQSSRFSDWLTATRLIDSIDEIGVYWSMVEGDGGDDSVSAQFKYWRNLFKNFSKHIQDGVGDSRLSPWLLEVLQVVFGDGETIRRLHPLSFILCPQSPLAIDQQHTDAYLEMVGWNIPVAVMPMPLMGGTAPGSLVSTVLLGNCEVLAMLCLIQASEPGTPFIYAPALAVTNPRTGGLSSGAIEGSLLGAASVEMARYYGLPVEASGGGTNHYVPGIQAGYERALNSLIPVLSWPDILVGPGLLGGSMVLSLEQLIIDVEIYKMSRRASQGIRVNENKWLDDVIDRVGHAGQFLGQRSTADAMRDGEWYISGIGWQDSYEKWEREGKPSLFEEVQERVDEMLASHQPLPLGIEVDRELQDLQKRAEVLLGESL
jgi:trimethylamine--corrinoid protein Co-methyltransferase